jgi:hypothetical protein
MCFAAALPRPALLCTLFGGVAGAIVLELAHSSALIFLTPRVDRAGNTPATRSSMRMRRLSKQPALSHRGMHRTELAHQAPRTRSFLPA